MTKFEKLGVMKIMQTESTEELEKVLDDLCIYCSLYRNGQCIDCEVCKIQTAEYIQRGVLYTKERKNK